MRMMLKYCLLRIRINGSIFILSFIRKSSWVVGEVENRVWNMINS